VKDGIVVEVSDDFLRLVGKKRDEVIGHTAVGGGFITKEQRASFFNELNKSGRVENFEMEIRPQSGVLRYGLFNAVMISVNNEIYLLTNIQDITERKQAEEALRESESKLNAMLQSMPDHMSMMDKELNLVWANEAAKRMFGNDIIGRKCYEAYHRRREPCEPYPCLTLKAFNDGGIHEHEIDVVDAAGKAIYFHCTATVALRDKDEKTITVIEISRDITEQKQAEDALRESEEKFNKAFRMSPIPTVISSMEDGRFLDVNETFLRTLLFSREEVIGRTSLELGSFANPDQRQAIRKITEEKGYAKDIETQMVAKNGQIIDGLFSAEPITINNEKCWLTVMVDVTEQKRAEDALRESRQQLNNIVDNIPVFVNYVNAHDLRYTFVSKKFADAFGKLPRQMIGRQVKEILDEGAYLHAQPYIDRACSGEQIQYENIVNIHGEPRWFNINYIPEIDEQETVKNIIVLAVDINDRKQAEADKEKLEAQNWQLQKAKSLDRMAGAIAHTFNNQLGVVIGNLEMAIDNLPKGSGSVNNLTAAMWAANKAAEVSGQMLTYLGQSFDKRELMDIAEFCRRNLPILQDSMPGTVTLETDLSSPGPVFMANANEIRQVLTNLVTNAWEAVDAGRGKIHLSVKTVSPADIPQLNRRPIAWQPQDSAYACIEVADTGDGIAHNDIEKLFDPFFTSKFTGRGLGLAMVLGIVKAHDGAITVESAPGQGCTFRIFFPVSADEVPRQPDKPAQPVAIEGGGTILLVDDEEMLRNMAAAMLNRLGFLVLAAKDGAEAVEMFKEHKDKIRLVLSDLTMPRMNGWETLTALRALAPGFPVILASGYDKVQVMAGEHPELPQVFLGKPYKLKELSDAISQALVGNKQ
jgi:two-component system cell cycle sensor histidine kinase/response regulator CckA